MRREPAPPLEPQRIYSLQQISRILQMRTDTVRQMAVDGVIPMIQFRGARGYRFLGWRVQQWLDGLQDAENGLQARKEKDYTERFMSWRYGGM